jgi:hypothetical protein
MVSKTMASNQSLYDRDFYAWANEQAALLRDGKLADADLPNIAEEIASMGRSERRELINRLTVLLLHLLKWRHQPGHRGRSWQLSIKEQRRKVLRHLGDNPSLKHQLAEIVSEAYEDATIEAARETGLLEATFPKISPWTYDHVMKEDWYPD